MKITGARIRAVICHILILGAAAIVLPDSAQAWPKQVGPFVYVADFESDSVSVIDPASNKVVATIGVGSGPLNLAVTPDGKHAYVANFEAGSVSVIDTATNFMTKEIKVGNDPSSVAITPDGRYAYVTNQGSGSISVIDIAKNKVSDTVRLLRMTPSRVTITPDGRHAYISPLSTAIPILDTATNQVTAYVSGLAGFYPYDIAITPDGKQAYATGYGKVIVIDTASNAVLKEIPVEPFAYDLVITPDGRKAYVAAYANVFVIDRASDAVVKTIPVIGTYAFGMAITPDGKRVYATNDSAPGTVSVIETLTDTVVAGIFPVGAAPEGAAAVPSPPGLPFDSVKIAGLSIDRLGGPKHGSFNFYAYVTLGAASNGIHPDTEPVTLMLDGYTTTIPPGSFQKLVDGSYSLFKWVNGSLYNASIKPQGGALYLVHLSQTFLTLPEMANPVQVRLIIGDDAGLVSVNATLSLPPGVQASK